MARTLGKIALFEILANFDVIFRGEGVEIEKNGGEYGKRDLQELFKYVIRFHISFLVGEILSKKEALHLYQFPPFFGIIGQLTSLQFFQNLPKRRHAVVLTLV